MDRPAACKSPYKAPPGSSLLDRATAWARLKKYRIEVTYGVYVFTPMEKLVFWSMFCFFFVLVSTTASIFVYRKIVITLLRGAASVIIDGRVGGELGSTLSVNEVVGQGEHYGSSSGIACPPTSSSFGHRC